MSSKIICGEPYDVTKRIIFSDYSYIRLPEIGWYDSQNRNVTVWGDSGLNEAHLRVEKGAFGIKIRSFECVKSDRPLSIEPIYPWEKDGICPKTIIEDKQSGVYKMWAISKADGQTYWCYLQSGDFENWQRPSLGLVDYNGSLENNLILTDHPLGSIFYDPSDNENPWKWIAESTMIREELNDYLKAYGDEWDPKSDRKDVPTKTHVGDSNLIICVRGGVSKDGYKWETLKNPLVVEHSDTIVTAYYDPYLKEYVGYFRDWDTRSCSKAYEGKYKGLGWMMGRRSIGRAQSKDFSHFPMSDIIMTPGPDRFSPSQTLYTNGHTFLPGTDYQHIFFPTVWDQSNDSTSVHLASSPDGVYMHWLSDKPILETGSFGRFDGGCLFATGDLLELPSGDWVMPYAAYNVPHKYPRKGCFEKSMGLMCWPKGRLAAVCAEEYGEFTTMAIIPSGDSLYINADVLRGGNIKIQVLGFDGNFIEGYSFDDCEPVIGDCHWVNVKWNGKTTLPSTENGIIMLQFKMKFANLFGIEFR